MTTPNQRSDELAARVRHDILIYNEEIRVAPQSVGSPS